MSKNDPLSVSVAKVGRVTKDMNFKDIIRYKGMAAIVIKAAIAQFNDSSLTYIANSIVNSRKRPKNLGISVLEDEIDFINPQAGTKDEKNTICDSIFQLDLTQSSKGKKRGKKVAVEIKSIDSKMLVNLEMQTSTDAELLGYNIVSRAIYYGASVLRSTVPAGDTHYENIQKVYSIWLCSDELKLTPYTEVKEEFFIHRYGIRRFYDEVPGKSAPPEKESDLIEVILIDLPKLKRLIEEGKIQNASKGITFLNELFNDNDKRKILDDIEKTENIKFITLKGDFGEMTDYKQLNNECREVLGQLKEEMGKVQEEKERMEKEYAEKNAQLAEKDAQLEEERKKIAEERRQLEEAKKALGK